MKRNTQICLLFVKLDICFERMLWMASVGKHSAQLHKGDAAGEHFRIQYDEHITGDPKLLG